MSPEYLKTGKKTKIKKIKNKIENEMYLNSAHKVRNHSDTFC